MPSQPPSAEPTLYTELIRRGLPADYARRTAEELDDHRADLLADLHSADADNPDEIANERLGETRQLAKRIAGDYRRRTWIGRWPVFCFVLAPIPLWITILLLCQSGLWALSYPFGGPMTDWLGSLSDWNRLITMTSIIMTVYALYFAVIPSLIAAKLSSLALRSTQSRVWAAAACLSIAVAAASMTYDLKLTLDPGGSSFAVRTPNLGAIPGVPALSSREVRVLPHYAECAPLAQLAAPLLAGFVVLRRDQRRRAAAMLATQAPEDRLRVAA